MGEIISAIAHDGSEVTWWRDERPEMEKEWWERPRSLPDADRRRQGRATWLMSGELKWWIPPPTNEKKQAEDPDGHSWLVRAAAGAKDVTACAPFPKVTTVSASSGCTYWTSWITSRRRNCYASRSRSHPSRLARTSDPATSCRDLLTSRESHRGGHRRSDPAASKRPYIVRRGTFMVNPRCRRECA